MWEFIWYSLTPRQRRLIIGALALLAAYTLIGFVILPPIIRSVATKELSRQLDREVSIREVKLNPFVLSATVDGLLIKDKDGQPFVSWDEVYVNFQLVSLFSKAWTFKEVSTTRPYLRAQMNWDGTFNFSDLIAKFATNAPAADARPSAPLVLHIARLHIAGAAAAFTDMTMRHPFTRVIGPLDVSLENFGTDPDNKNPYSFAGTTDAGETFSWSGYFYLDPVRSRGELTLGKIGLNKYAPLYQDFVKFDIRDGSVALHANYDFAWSETNRQMSVTNTSFALRNFRLGALGDTNDIIALPLFGVTGVNVDLESHRAEVGSVLANGADLNVQRGRDRPFNVVEISTPADTQAGAPGGILFLLRSVTNAVALLLNSTNDWRATVHAVDFTNCALHLTDLVNSRPAKLDLTGLSLAVRNISNVPNTNLTAAVAMRWNTNGTIQAAVSASFSPPTVDLLLALTNLDLGTLDPYLEPKLNLLILGSRLGLTGALHLRTPAGQLPQVTFQGDARLDGLHTVDGTMGEDLLKWDSLQFSGIDANLNPQVVAIREIALDNAYARVVIETNRAINLLTALTPAETNIPAKATFPVLQSKLAAATNQLDRATAPKISIGRIVISNAALRFTDLSVSPNVNLAVQSAGGTIDGISSEQLQHADVSLHAVVDEVGPVAITGHLNPFSGTQTNIIKVSVKDVDLTPTSPYAGKFAGYRIARGKLNLALEYNLVGKQLTSKNVITLDQFTFGEKVNSAEATHLPVRLAIAILKDRNGQIVLDVPVDGSLDDPQLRIGKVVTRAIVNILEKVATSPFSLIGAMFGGGEELSYQDFAPGSSEMLAASTNKLNSLGKALYARPALQLEIAGSVDPASDRDGLQRLALDKAQRTTATPDQLMLTPDQRAAWVKKLFAEAQADGAITPAMISANTNLSAAVTQLVARKPAVRKGATLLMRQPIAVMPANAPAADSVVVSKLPSPADPMEVLLLATLPVSENDLETLAADRAKAVRAYLLQGGQVEDAQLFITANQTGGVRSDGSRVYLQFQ